MTTLGLSALPPAPGERRRVLVVDDEPGVCYMARRVLESRFDVREAGSGEEALRVLEGEAFHLCIVDVRLPGISGLDLLATIKNLSPECDVIVMTGSAADIDEALEGAIRRRAFFFLRKPFPMTILETLASRVAEKQELEERLARHTRTLERNLESARIFQRSLLPRSPWAGERIRVASHYAPSEQLGGDFYDYWPLPDGGTALLIADVMGHGPLAAMVTGIVKSQLHSLASEIHDPGEILYVLEEELRRIALPAFLSAFLVIDRPEEGEVAWAGAGHPPALLRRPGTPARGPHDPAASLPELLISDGMLINTGLPLQTRRARTIAREPGASLLLFTDGYPESVNRAGVPFDGGGTDSPPEEIFAPGSPFCAAVAQALAADPLEDGIRRLEEARNAYADGAPAEDDRAAVLVRLD